MANARFFPGLVPLMDIQINALAPNSQGTAGPINAAVGAAGQPNYIVVTPNVLPNNSAALPSGLVAEALIVEVISPVVQTAGGVIVFPDFNWWFYPDSTDMQKFQNFDGAFGTNMMPVREYTEGRKNVALGISLRKLLTEAANNHQRNNMALLATGIKYASTLAAKLASVRGWGIAGDVVVNPGRIRVWGERYTTEMLKKLASLYDGHFERTGLRRVLDGVGPIKGDQNGSIAIENWTSLPGGYAQSGGATVNRYFNFATNLVQTGTQAPFILSNNNTPGGAPGNVGAQNDLGWGLAPTQGVAKDAKDALIIQEFGVAPGTPNLAFAGIQVGGATVPDPNGWPVGTNAVRYAYGQAAPLRSDSGQYFYLPELEGQLDILGENAAIFITAGGAAIGANAASVAVGGVRITLA